MSCPRDALPLVPLLHAHAARGLSSAGVLHQLPVLGPRFSAVLGATVRFLYTDFLDAAPDDAFRDAIVRFYDAVVALPMHGETLRRRAGFVRHAASAILHGSASAPDRLDACLSSGGMYHVPGLGPAFWSALLQATVPARLPGWTGPMLAGLERFHLVKLAGSAASTYSGLIEAHARIRAVRRELSALHIDHFLSLIAAMPGRDLGEASIELTRCPVKQAIERSRTRSPLRDRLKSRGQSIADGQQVFEAALEMRDGRRLGEALALADPVGSARCHLDWAAHAETLVRWLSRLWKSEDPYPELREFWKADPLPGAGLWLPCAVLHLRDPMRFLPCNDPLRQAHARLDDGLASGDPPAERYRLFNEAGAWLREQFTLHPLELADVLLAVVGEEPRPAPEVTSLAPPEPRFRGFCVDTFAFLNELAESNRRDWMESQRDRYRFGVRNPMLELCRSLASRYVEPVLCTRHGWDIDTEVSPGHALTSICKNAFGRSVPYNAALWVTFCRRGTARAGAQLFVRLAGDGLRWGLRLGRSASEDRARLRAGIEQHGDSIFDALRSHGAIACRFGSADLPETHRPLASVDDLLVWARGRTQEACWSVRASDPLASNADLAGEILLGFDRLLPLFAACMEASSPALASVPREGFGESDFLRETYLSPDWLRRTIQLLGLKKQLILQGVPGTGKTHVARALARLLAGGGDSVKLVQFHPAYSYEEFVEGIRVKSIAVEGRHDVTYPVEDGLLCSFAAQAAESPAKPHVLVIDEINRGNLPRIFGELLYLLEYRGQALELPCSRRSFQLPANLLIVATMNAADRSIAALDQALRRRFSFVEMEPDAEVLAAWLRTHPVTGGSSFAARVLGLFEKLNSRLQSEAGPAARIGHSYFMVEGLDEERLRMIWRHHVRPIVEDLLGGRTERIAGYDALVETPRRARGEPVAQL